jgi:hypothetical protein
MYANNADSTINSENMANKSMVTNSFKFNLTGAL